ncbi:hypothetical protein H2199_007756 [Coniosporium tulheliwenetii]|uniref:Uncharacterized protein n=1 Tax=Coniosporium tulheliwenetii TaxID=3383036 RepID=A0ACC2YN21_9PEZI|nr:hypothetical protein H2199_007756 [Cladosporium sp. JES 115]
MTDFTVEPLREYTHIGVYEVAPSRIQPFDQNQSVFTCYGTDGIGPIFMGSLADYYDFYFAIVSFTDLYDGTWKAGVRQPSPGLLLELQQDYYPSEKMNKLQRSAASRGSTTSEPSSIQSALYRTKDEDGKEVALRIVVTVTPGQQLVITISERRYDLPAAAS